MSSLQVLLVMTSFVLTFGHNQQQAYGQQAYQQQQPHGQQQFGQPHQQANQNVLHDSQRIHDREHIKEHLHGVLGEPDLSKLSEEELQFHYFKMHDNDNNNKLDGCELIKSLIHWHGMCLLLFYRLHFKVKSNMFPLFLSLFRQFSS